MTLLYFGNWVDSLCSNKCFFYLGGRSDIDECRLDDGAAVVVGRPADVLPGVALHGLVDDEGAVLGHGHAVGLAVVEVDTVGVLQRKKIRNTF